MSDPSPQPIARPAPETARVYPKISIITTNYNLGEYLEDTILSVLNQNYPNLEYIIIDGGSSDGSKEIIKKYESRLAYWESKPDRGYVDAYNKGFARATGEIVAYLSSDDVYCPWAFELVSRVFQQLPEVQWLTTLYPLTHSRVATFVQLLHAQPFHRELFYAGFYNGRNFRFLQQESTFWRKSLWDKAGGYIDERVKLAIDADLWARFFELTELYALDMPLGGFRYRPESKSNSDMAGYLTEMGEVAGRSAKKMGVTLRWRPSQINRFTRRFLNAPARFVPKKWLYRAPVVKWDFGSNKYFVDKVRIRF